MRLAITAWSPEIDLPRIARHIDSATGLEVAVVPPTLEGASLRREATDQVFAISPDPAVVQLGERLHRLRQSLEQGIPICACMPRPTPADREVVEECGAARIVTPEGWRAEQIADRILAELIVAGDVEPSVFCGIVGATPKIRESYDRITRMAPLREPVLILGETGTGKELVARALHEKSPRAGEILAFNCAALTPDLLESELFGHERGAFSGAVSARKGLLVEAGAGTVFLDEIGDLAASSQAKLLRVLDERKVRPVGSNRWTPIEARMVLATHRNLEEACADGRFREDLFHRISTLAIQLPPLRERKADLLLLAEHFLAEYNREYPGSRFAPPGALDSLFRYHWPGNVRELRKAIWQSATFAASSDGPIGTLSLQEWSNQAAPRTSSRWNVPFDPLGDSWREVQDRLRRAYFQAVLRECGGNKDEAARRAGLSRSQFYEILKQVESKDDGT